MFRLLIQFRWDPNYKADELVNNIVSSDSNLQPFPALVTFHCYINILSLLQNPNCSNSTYSNGSCPLFSLNLTINIHHDSLPSLFKTKAIFHSVNVSTKILHSITKHKMDWYWWGDIDVGITGEKMIINYVNETYDNKRGNMEQSKIKEKTQSTNEESILRW